VQLVGVYTSLHNSNVCDLLFQNLNPLPYYVVSQVDFFNYSRWHHQMLHSNDAVHTVVLSLVIKVILYLLILF